MNIYNVTESDFNEQVIAASHDRPVVVDFYTQSCPACGKLRPVLEDVVNSYNGELALALIDAGVEQNLAMQFQIQGVPAVKIFKNGEIITEFAGALDRAQLEQLFKKIVPTAEDKIVEEAANLHASGYKQAAAEKYKEVLSREPEHASAKLGLAYILIEDSEFNEARELAKTISPGTEEHKLAETLLAQLELMDNCDTTTGQDALEAKLARNPDDLDTRFALCNCLASQGSYEAALEGYLHIIKKDKNYQEGAAKEAMLRVFTVVGKTSDLTRKYRTQLSRALY